MGHIARRLRQEQSRFSHSAAQQSRDYNRENGRNEKDSYGYQRALY